MTNAEKASRLRERFRSGDIAAEDYVFELVQCVELNGDWAGITLSGSLTLSDSYLYCAPEARDSYRALVETIKSSIVECGTFYREGIRPVNLDALKSIALNFDDHCLDLSVIVDDFLELYQRVIPTEIEMAVNTGVEPDVPPWWYRVVIDRWIETYPFLWEELQEKLGKAIDSVRAHDDRWVELFGYRLVPALAEGVCRYERWGTADE